MNELIEVINWRRYYRHTQFTCRISHERLACRPTHQTRDFLHITRRHKCTQYCWHNVAYYRIRLLQHCWHLVLYRGVSTTSMPSLHSRAEWCWSSLVDVRFQFLFQNVQ